MWGRLVSDLCGMSTVEQGAQSQKWSFRRSPASSRLGPALFVSFEGSLEALWSSRTSHAQPILSLPHNPLSPQVTEDFHRTSDEFGRVSSRNSACDAVTVSVKKDRPARAP